MGPLKPRPAAPRAPSNPLIAMKTHVHPNDGGDGITLPDELIRASGLSGEVEVTAAAGQIIISGGLPAETPEQKAERGRRMAEALDEIARAGAARAFGDPTEWQRAERQDRPLPGRE